ncbi:MAG: hypothetical protein AB7L09_01795 [Nitrospira sp.]
MIWLSSLCRLLFDAYYDYSVTSAQARLARRLRARLSALIKQIDLSEGRIQQAADGGTTGYVDSLNQTYTWNASGPIYIFQSGIRTPPTPVPSFGASAISRHARESATSALRHARWAYYYDDESTDAIQAAIDMLLEFYPLDALLAESG